MKTTFRFFSNPEPKSKKVEILVRRMLRDIKNFTESNTTADFNIAVGGDGSFLHMVRACDYNPKLKYVGINTGTLGFLQEIKPDDLAEFIRNLKNGEFTEEQVSYIKSMFRSKQGEASFNCLNELVIREEQLKTMYMDVRVNGDKLENFAGDGVLMCTSIGSTAQNLGYGGSIVPSQFDTLQLTPIAPTNTPNNLRNSIILPNDAVIEMSPEHRTKNLFISNDGENSTLRNVKYIQVQLAPDKISRITMPNYSFYNKVHEKFSSN